MKHIKKSSHLQGYLQMVYGKKYRAWDSPIAPSKNECQIIKKFIVKKSPRVLILGSTPRFRDLVHSLKAEVTCVDASIDMILAMRGLMKYQKQTEKEIWVRANWLKMSLAQNYWDYVLGDWVICNIPLKLQPLFLKKVSQLLKPGGYFITRHALISRQFSGRDLEQAIDNYLSGKFNASDIIWASGHLGYNAKNYQNNSTKFIKRAEKVISKSNKKIRQIWKKISPPPGMSWVYTPPKILEPMMKKYFKIVAIKYGADNHFQEECPIYVLKKK